MKKANDKGQMLAILFDRVREIVGKRIDTDEKLSAICKLLKESLPHYDWVGFYLVDPKTKGQLILGPFDGEPTEHKRIPFGKGVCGEVAESKETYIVDDVSKVENYLSCSLEVKSEIVVPIFKNGEVVGELDIDSHALATFTEEDKKFLENVCELVSRLF